MSLLTAHILDYATPASQAARGEAIAAGQAASMSSPVAAGRFEGIIPVRMVAAFFVVVNHTTYQGLANAPEQVSDALRTLNNVGWMVPFFFILAGFLFSRSAQDMSDAKIAAQCVKSVKRVLLLWLVWSAIYCLNDSLSALLHGDLNALHQRWSAKFAATGPSLFWIGPSYHLWFLASLLMAWVLLGLVEKTSPRLLRRLVNERSAKSLLATVGIAAVVALAASQLPRLPASPVGIALEVLILHAMLPLTCVLIGVALWHQRTQLAKPAVAVALLGVGGLVIWAEIANSFGLHGPGPRSLSTGGALLATAALSIGLQLPITQPLGAAWNVSAGVYCLHMIVVSRTGRFFADMEHWSASLLLAVTAFALSLLVCFVLSRFSLTGRLVK